MCDTPEWCWFKDDSYDPVGPFPAREEAIEDANKTLDKEGWDESFYVSRCVHAKPEQCFPKEDKEVAEVVLGMLDENCDEFYRNPEDLSFSLVEGANVKVLKDFLTEWAKKYVRHDYVLPDPSDTQEVSRIVSRRK